MLAWLVVWQVLFCSWQRLLLHSKGVWILNTPDGAMSLRYPNWKREALRTTWHCIVFYALSFGIVQLLWPVLSKLTESWPKALPGIISGTAAFLLFWTITHMQRGQMNPLNYPYMILYGVVCLLFGLSTVPPSQYNTGSAALQMAFVLMLGWQIFQKHRRDRKPVLRLVA